MAFRFTATAAAFHPRDDLNTPEQHALKLVGAAAVVVTEAIVRQNNLVAQLRRLIGDKIADANRNGQRMVEFPAVWLSSAPVWEPSATKGVIEDGIRRQASLAELIGLCGCLVRIEIDPAAVRMLEADKFRETLRIPANVHDRLIAAGLEMGADPVNWRAVVGSVPLTAFRRIEFSVEPDPPHWIPWPGLRLRAS